MCPLSEGEGGLSVREGVERERGRGSREGAGEEGTEYERVREMTQYNIYIIEKRHVFEPWGS